MTDTASTLNAEADVSELLDASELAISPIIYEDFLPVSAAGIFQSNLGDEAQSNHQVASSKSQFEAAMGCQVADEFELYEQIQALSLSNCLNQLKAT